MRLKRAFRWFGLGLALGLVTLQAPSVLAGADNELNGNGTVQASTTVTSAVTTTGSTFYNYHFRGIVLTVYTTTLTGTSSTLTVTVQTKDPLSGNWVALPGCATAAINSVTVTMLVCYPGINVSANSTVSTILPYQWRIVSTAGGTPTNVTWTVGGQFLQ
ncbi:MAG TPA: hypothetical protein VKU80_15510 [Planctomycetota bacterium]|nr:hypothetical protein [Planctomycetota bacterium]